MKRVLLFLVLLMAVLKPTLSDAKSSRLTCLAEGIYHEARGESEEGRIGVASVIMNRTRSWNDTICNIVYQRSSRGCQFSWACQAHPIKEMQSYREAMNLAVDILAGNVPDNTVGAKYFHRCSDGVAVGHVDYGMVLTKVIGHTCFYVPLSDIIYSDNSNLIDQNGLLWYERLRTQTG